MLCFLVLIYYYRNVWCYLFGSSAEKCLHTVAQRAQAIVQSLFMANTKNPLLSLIILIYFNNKNIAI